MQFSNPNGQGCSVPSAARALLRARSQWLLNRIVPDGHGSNYTITTLKYLRGSMKMTKRAFSVELFVLKLSAHKKIISNHAWILYVSKTAVSD